MTFRFSWNILRARAKMVTWQFPSLWLLVHTIFSLLAGFHPNMQGLLGTLQPPGSHPNRERLSRTMDLVKDLPTLCFEDRVENPYSEKELIKFSPSRLVITQSGCHSQISPINLPLVSRGSLPRLCSWASSSLWLNLMSHPELHFIFPEDRLSRTV